MTDDLINRQAAIDVIHHTIYEFFDVVEDDDESPITYKDMKLLELNKSISTRINDLPTADVVGKERYDRLHENANILAEALNEYQNADYVEVVRCKDCKYWDTEWWVKVGNKHYCELIDGFREENWFCADGERREDDTN